MRVALAKGPDLFVELPVEFELGRDRRGRGVIRQLSRENLRLELEDALDPGPIYLRLLLAGLSIEIWGKLRRDGIDDRLGRHLCSVTFRRVRATEPPESPGHA